MLVVLTAASLAAAPATEQCDTGGTRGMAECMDRKIERARARLNQYRARAIQRFLEQPDRDPATAEAIKKAAQSSDVSRDAYCDAVYQRWAEGSIRYTMHQWCTLRLIDRETHDIWSDFLGYIQDDVSPLLPEPMPTKS